MKFPGLLALTASVILAVKYAPGIINAVNVGANFTSRFNRIEKVKFYGGLINPKMGFNLVMDVNNPTKSEAKITYIDVALIDDKGKSWANVTRSDANLRLAKLSTQSYPIPVEIRLGAALLNSVLPAAISSGMAKTNFLADMGKYMPKQFMAVGYVRINDIKVKINQIVKVA